MVKKQEGRVMACHVCLGLHVGLECDGWFWIEREISSQATLMAMALAPF